MPLNLEHSDILYDMYSFFKRHPNLCLTDSIVGLHQIAHTTIEGLQAREDLQCQGKHFNMNNINVFADAKFQGDDSDVDMFSDENIDRFRKCLNIADGNSIHCLMIESENVQKDLGDELGIRLQQLVDSKKIQNFAIRSKQFLTDPEETVDYVHDFSKKFALRKQLAGVRFPTNPLEVRGLDAIDRAEKYKMCVFGDSLFQYRGPKNNFVFKTFENVPEDRFRSELYSTIHRVQELEEKYDEDFGDAVRTQVCFR